MSATKPAATIDVVALCLRAGGRAGGRVLFGPLDLRVATGERWVVIGPNGAGKSSLLAAMAGVFDVSDGRIAIDGRVLADWRPDALADLRAWSPQFWSDPFPATVRETAALAHRRDRAWRDRTSAEADPVVDGVLARLALGDLADVDVQTLSGGERQRVAIATALLQDTPVLLLDEPASHLDLAHQRLLIDVLLEHAAAGGSVVASLHDLNLAWDLASHCVLLDGRGHAVAGTREAILRPERLGAVFGVTVDAIDVAGSMRFVVSASVASTRTSRS
jgi:iron complex transport system ATP-binding protein